VAKRKRHLDHLQNTQVILKNQRHSYLSIFNYIRLLEPVPVYMVYGDKAASKTGAIRLYDALNGPKERLVIEGAGNFYLYWMPEYVNPAVEGSSGLSEEICAIGAL
jgi:hypothetical protein